ncbi:hypothetical protein [Micromonospora sp. LH3U1]|uniref:hypothetical protein n=1 Tax=Micromonospora sp. LH3U1 TaxID=3018339 RepID=UPI00234A45D2|nr:hypothetical protein [Micromonospora sp. LH3U1]WCN84290.1 hypothetical protein PCA76_15150 [Micromonospora sp. LH3U1]
MRRRQATGALVLLALFALIMAARFTWPEMSPTLRYLGGGLIAAGLLVMLVGFAARERRRRSGG